jgi:endonuclease YncB( thermonuclease family)
MAQSGHSERNAKCPLLGVKRTWETQSILRNCFTFSLLVVASLPTFFTKAAQMNVVKFERRPNPWATDRPTPVLGVSRYRVIKYSIMLGVLAFLFAALFWQYSLDNRAPLPSMSVASISVIDGDTIRSNRQVYRLVGFDTPEFGSRARCERERTLADAATNRLRQLVANGQTALEPVPCSCPPGTEGTRECNHGRLCARLRAEGRDVGTILINEGLARPYVCGQTGCPRRQSWCG